MGVQSRPYPQPGPVPPKMPLEASGTGPWAALGPQRQGVVWQSVSLGRRSHCSPRGSPLLEARWGSPDSLHRGSGDQVLLQGMWKVWPQEPLPLLGTWLKCPQAPLSREKGKGVRYSGQPQGHHGDHQTELRSSSKSALVKPMGVGFLTPSPW